MIFFSLRFFLNKKSIALTMLLFPFELDINQAIKELKTSIDQIYISLKLDINYANVQDTARSFRHLHFTKVRY